MYNALAAIALCRELGVDMKYIKKGLADFTGTNRRFEKKGELKGVTIIDDYAHHPREISATLATAKNYGVYSSLTPIPGPKRFWMILPGVWRRQTR